MPWIYPPECNRPGCAGDFTDRAVTIVQAVRTEAERGAQPGELANALACHVCGQINFARWAPVSVFRPFFQDLQAECGHTERGAFVRVEMIPQHSPPKSNVPELARWVNERLGVTIDIPIEPEED